MSTSYYPAVSLSDLRETVSALPVFVVRTCRAALSDAVYVAAGVTSSRRCSVDGHQRDGVASKCFCVASAYGAFSRS